MAPKNKTLTYRAIAINCADDESGATDTVIITKNEKLYQKTDDEIKVYPLVTKDQIHIINAQNETISLLTLKGEILLHQNISNSNTVINLGAYTNGFYLLKAGKQVFKIIKH